MCVKFNAARSSSRTVVMELCTGHVGSLAMTPRSGTIIISRSDSRARNIVGDKSNTAKRLFPLVFFFLLLFSPEILSWRQAFILRLASSVILREGRGGVATVLEDQRILIIFWRVIDVFCNVVEGWCQRKTLLCVVVEIRTVLFWSVVGSSMECCHRLVQENNIIL